MHPRRHNGLRNIARLHSSVSKTTAEILIHAYITSRLDYCISHLFGLLSTNLQKFQYIQNSAACLLTYNWSSTSPLSSKLHLPKILTDCPTRHLCSADSNLLNPIPARGTGPWGTGPSPLLLPNSGTHSHNTSGTQIH